MDYKPFVRRPFIVEAVEITEDNVAEIAKLIGTLKVDEDGTTYIEPDRRIIPNLRRCYVGWFLSRVDNNYRAWAPEYFNAEFLPWRRSVTFDFPELPETVEYPEESSDEKLEEIPQPELSPDAEVSRIEIIQPIVHEPAPTAETQTVE